MKKAALIGVLGKHFGEDPEAVEQIHKVIKKDYDRRLGKTRLEMTAAHQQEVAELRKDFKKTLEETVKEIQKGFRKEIATATKAVLAEATQRVKEVDKKTENVSDKVKSLKDRVTLREETTGRALEKQSDRIEGITAAIGAPNRSVYVAGVLPSDYYSDINLVEGSGITISTSTDHITGQANITITAGGSSGSNIDSQTVNVVQSGSDVTIDLTQLPHTALSVIEVFRNGQAVQPNGNAGLPGSSWSQSATTVTVYNADPTDVYMVQYTF